MGAASGFTLDGSGSYDPDGLFDSSFFTYSWRCGSCPDSVDSALGTSATTTVAANSLTAGTYVFWLNVTAGTRSAATSTTVEVLSGTPPTMDMAALPKAKYNKDEEFVSLSASAAGATSTSWTVVDSDVKKVFKKRNVATAQISNRATATVMLSALTVGKTYTFRFTALSGSGSSATSAYSHVTLTINEAPSSGYVSVVPRYGLALRTLFTFSATNWEDEDLPLTYIFGTTSVDKNGTITSKRVPFSDAISDASYPDLVLYKGQEGTANNYSVGCYVEALDWYGASGEDTDTIFVRPQDLSLGQLLNQSSLATEEALAGGDAEASRLLILATAAALGSSTDDTTAGSAVRRQRQLLASGDGTTASNTAERTTLMADLWETYAITEITAADVASLLATLEGIVDTPREISDPTAASALGLMRAILQALKANDVELTPTAGGFVGTALESLFHTGVFNNSFGVSSLAYASNVTEIVRLASAAELFGSFDGVGFFVQSASGGVEM